MGEKLYNIVFLGPAKDNADYVDRVAVGLMASFNLPIESATKMISWAPITVKKGLTFKEAANYRVVLESLGAQVRLEPMDNASGDKPVFRPETDTEVSKRRPYLLLVVMAIITTMVIIMGMNIIGLYVDSAEGIEFLTSLPF